MQHDETSSNTEVQRTLDRETDLLTGAIYLVASGGAPSTIVAGLRLGEAAMALVAELATDKGVILEALWTADENGYDVRVRRVSPG